jgi:hypothetical protein
MPTNNPMFDFVDDNKCGPFEGWVGNIEKLSKPIDKRIWARSAIIRV